MPDVKIDPHDLDSRIGVPRRFFLRLFAASASLCLGLGGPLFAEDPAGEPRVLSFGVLADVQYRDADPRGTRYYRESLAKLRECVQQFQRLRPDFVVQLGDLIDSDFASYDAVLSDFEQLTMPKYHVLGNHDLSVDPAHQDQVLVKLGLDRLADGKGYYEFTHAGWHFVVLNGNDRPLAKGLPAVERQESPAHLLETLRKEWTKKADAWNGVVGLAQREWLERTLTRAAAAGQRTIVFCHFPLCGPGALAFLDNAEIMRILEAHPGVVACFSGHLHAGDYSQHNGLHYLTLRGMIETQETAYAWVEVYRDELRVTGFGREPSRLLRIPNDRSPAAKP